MRLTYAKPPALNGERLANELAAAGITISTPSGVVLDCPELEWDPARQAHVLVLHVPDDTNATTVANIVAAHIGAPTAAQQAEATRLADARDGLGALAATPGIRAKCRSVLAGTDTFTVAQRDRALAALILLELRNRADT